MPDGRVCRKLVIHIIQLKLTFMGDAMVASAAVIWAGSSASASWTCQTHDILEFGMSLDVR